MRRTIGLLAGLCVITTSGWCAEHGDEGSESEHQPHKHHVAVFLGNTHDYHGTDAFTVGADYEYRLSNLIGLGGFVDYAGGDIDAVVVGGGLFIHPWRDLRLLTGAGKEMHNGHGELLVRLGVSYDFHIKKWILTPVIDVDLLENGHQNWVYGIAVGKAF
jgi:hypothetical protein